MPFMTIAIFIAGGLVGWLVSRVQQSIATKSVFEDEIEADIMRGKAQQSVVERIERRKSRIMQVAQEEGRITNDAVEELYCISDRTASNYLNQLVASGELSRHSTGRGTFYTPIAE